jgi:hypothetical protein
VVEAAQVERVLPIISNEPCQEVARGIEFDLDF